MKPNRCGFARSLSAACRPVCMSSHRRVRCPQALPSFALRSIYAFRIGVMFFFLLLASVSFSSCDNGGFEGKTPYPPYDFFSMPTDKVEHYDKIIDTYSNAYYVSLSGNDTNDGSLEHPFRTIQKAVGVVKEGEAVFIRGGIYEERVIITKSGASGKPIVIRSFPNEEVVLDGKTGLGLGETNSQGEVNWESGLIQLKGAKHIALAGLKIVNSKTSGIYGRGVKDGTSWAKFSENIVVYKCAVEDCLAPAICFGADYSPSKNIFVIQNGVTNCAQVSREAISLRSVDSFEIAYNNVRRVKKESIDAKCGCKDGDIHHNIVSDVGFESSLPSCGIYLDAWAPKISGNKNENYSSDDGIQRNIKVHCNIVKNLVHAKNGATGIAVASEEGNNQENIFIYNNLVYNTGAKCGAGIKIANNSDVKTGLIQNVFVYNNTVYGTDQQAFYINFPNVKDIAFVNNICVNTNAPAFSLLDENAAAKVSTKRNLVGNPPRYKNNGDIIPLQDDEVKVLSQEDVENIFENVSGENFHLAKKFFCNKLCF